MVLRRCVRCARPTRFTTPIDTLDTRPLLAGATDMAEERVERRLSAILAAEIAGYRALMGADEARTVRDLKGHQAVVLPMVGEFGGRPMFTIPP
jgi:hypothetical protein